jgi:hypothetical protein
MRKISVRFPSLGTEVEFEISRVQSNSAKYSAAMYGEVIKRKMCWDPRQLFYASGN